MLSAAELRLHPQVVGAIDRLWTAITGYGKFREYSGFIDREQYVLLSIQVGRNALAPAEEESCFDNLSHLNASSMRFDRCVTTKRR